MARMQFCPEQLFDGFPEPTLIIRSGSLRYFNPAAVRLFPGLSPEAALPDELSALLDAVDGPTVLLSRVDGADWRVSVQDTPEGFLLLFRVDDAQSAPFRADRLSVHLRQQTAGLAAALQRLFLGKALAPDKYDQYLSVANQGLYRLMRLADHLEFLDRDREHAYVPAPVDLAGLCREVADGMEDICRHSGYRFTYEADLTSLITVGDDVQLRRMLLALLSNAMKAAGQGGKFGARLSKMGKRAVITVWDNGPGLDNGNMSFLFGGEAGKLPSLEAGEGMGLGLTAVRRVVSLHGGTVMIESREDDGLRAIVSLPLREPGPDMPLRTPRTAYTSGHFSDFLVELSDVLPARFYMPDEME
ncbi:MAG: HAMP domain-containing histidine kinase [Clostridia bacterium]|nr:HAMP domain-containing histidine kinase [Clostridia bacterium]